MAGFNRFQCVQCSRQIGVQAAGGLLHTQGFRLWFGVQGPDLHSLPVHTQGNRLGLRLVGFRVQGTP